MKRSLARLLFAVCASVSWMAAHAQSLEDVLKQKPLRILVGYPSGSGYDVFARLLSRHMGRHTPGNPSVVVENMPGVAGLTMMNFLYNSAPRDGSVIAAAPKNLLLDPLFGNDQARFDALKTTWIGSATKDNSLCFTWQSSPVKKIEDAMARETLVGATGRTADSYFIPQLLNSFFGTKFKIVLGYPDSGAVGIAMERGEIDGACGFTIGTIRSAKPDWLGKKQINFMLQVALERSAEFPDIPSLSDYTKTEEARQAFLLAFGVAPMSRPVAAPPEVPADRVAALRQAFGATMKDSDFLADAKKIQIEIDPIGGDESLSLLKKLYATPPAVVKKVIAIRDET